MADREFELWTGSGYTKVRKGVLFAKRTPFREKDFYFYELTLKFMINEMILILIL